MIYSDCLNHFIPGSLYHVIYFYCFILPEAIAVYFNFNIDNCHARILQIVTYSISVWILSEDKNKLQLQLHRTQGEFQTTFCAEEKENIEGSRLNLRGLSDIGFQMGTSCRKTFVSADCSMWGTEANKT